MIVVSTGNVFELVYSYNEKGIPYRIGLRSKLDGTITYLSSPEGLEKALTHLLNEIRAKENQND